MRITFSKPTPDATGFARLIESYPSAGFAGLQLKGDQYASYVGLPDGPDRFRSDWGSDPGHVESLITGNALDAEGIARLRSLIDFAAGVGSRRIVLCHGRPRAGVTDADLVGYATLLSDLGAESLDRGVRLSLHHHTDQPVMHRRDFDVFFHAVVEHRVGLTVDTGHLVRSGITDVAALITDLAPHVDNVHLKDYAAGEFQLLGHGDVGLGAALAAIQTLSDEVTLCVDEESAAGLAEGLRVSRQYLDDRARWLTFPRERPASRSGESHDVS